MEKHILFPTELNSTSKHAPKVWGEPSHVTDRTTLYKCPKNQLISHWVILHKLNYSENSNKHPICLKDVSQCARA